MKQHEFQKAEVFTMNSSVEYSSHSIVSKMVIKKENGQVTLFAFDAGEELSEHTSPFDAMVQIIDGAAEVLISGQSFTINTGESIILPANIPHAVKAKSRFKMILTMIK